MIIVRRVRRLGLESGKDVGSPCASGFMEMEQGDAKGYQKHSYRSLHQGGAGPNQRAGQEERDAGQDGQRYKAKSSEVEQDENDEDKKTLPPLAALDFIEIGQSTDLLFHRRDKMKG